MDETHRVAHRVLVAIRQIVRRISIHSKDLSRDVGLTVPQLLCLKAIGEMETTFEEVTVAMVSGEVKLSPATVSRIVERLVRAQFVHRERSKRDRRRVVLSLTTKGMDRFNALPIPLQDRFVKRFVALSEHEQNDILDALNRIAQFMEADEMDASPILAPGDVIKVEQTTAGD